jgi:hypothetical protein
MTDAPLPPNARHSGESWAAAEPKHRRDDTPVDALPPESVPAESEGQPPADAAAPANPYDRAFDISEFGENPDIEVAG